MSPQDSSENLAPVEGDASHPNQDKRKPGQPPDSSRRSFIGKMGIGSAAAVALAAVPLEPLIEGKHGEAEASAVQYGASQRMQGSYNYRKNIAAHNIGIAIELPDNGDLQRFTDYSGSW